MIQIQEISPQLANQLVPQWDATMPNDFDPWQRPNDYRYFRIYDLNYWDAIVAYSRSEMQVEAIRSQVIDIDEATKIIEKHLKEKNKLFVGSDLYESLSK